MTNAEQFSQSLRGLRERIASQNTAHDTPLPGSIEFELTAQMRALMAQLQATAEKIEDRRRTLAQSAAELASRFEAYRDILKTVPCACIVTDLAGLVLDANAAAVSLLGHRELATLRRKPLAVFIPLAERRAFRQRLLQAHRLPSTLAWDGTILPRGRAPFAGQVMMTPIRDQDGELRELCWTMSSAGETGSPCATQDVGEAPADSANRQAACDQIAEQRGRVRIFSDEQVAWQEDTEAALADELVNRLGQDLAAVRVTWALQGGALAASPTGAQQTGDLERMTSAVMVDLHDLAMALHPVSLDRFGLLPAIEMIADTHSRSSEGLVSVEAMGLDDQRLPPDLEGLVFRLVQEALAAFVRDLVAGSLSVTLSWSGEWLRVVVESLAATSVPKELDRQPGWVAVKSRVEILGGMAGGESTHDGATSIWAAIPARHSHNRKRAMV